MDPRGIDVTVKDEQWNCDIENRNEARKRRSSILKLPKSPHQHPLSELNAEIQVLEKRKSLLNKRVSFADKYEVAEFDREHTKDTETSQENIPPSNPSLILRKSCLPIVGPTTDASLIQKIISGNPVMHHDVDNTRVTQYFQNSFANMCDITMKQSFELRGESDHLNQHNITDNAVEDMSLTLTLGSCSTAAAAAAVVVDLAVKQQRDYISLSKVNDISINSVEVMRSGSVDDNSLMITNEPLKRILGSENMVFDDEEFCPDAATRFGGSTHLDVSMYNAMDMSLEMENHDEILANDLATNEEEIRSPVFEADVESNGMSNAINMSLETENHEEMLANDIVTTEKELKRPMFEADTEPNRKDEIQVTEVVSQEQKTEASDLEARGEVHSSTGAGLSDIRNGGRGGYILPTGQEVISKVDSIKPLDFLVNEKGMDELVCLEEIAGFQPVAKKVSSSDEKTSQTVYFEEPMELTEVMSAPLKVPNNVAALHNEIVGSQAYQRSSYGQHTAYFNNSMEIEETLFSPKTADCNPSVQKLNTQIIEAQLEPVDTFKAIAKENEPSAVTIETAKEDKSLPMSCEVQHQNPPVACTPTVEKCLVYQDISQTTGSGDVKPQTCLELPEKNSKAVCIPAVVATVQKSTVGSSLLSRTRACQQRLGLLSSKIHGNNLLPIQVTDKKCTVNLKLNQPIVAHKSEEPFTAAENPVVQEIGIDDAFGPKIIEEACPQRMAISPVQQNTPVPFPSSMPKNNMAKSIEKSVTKARPLGINFNAMLKCQKLLKSPSRIPVKCPSVDTPAQKVKSVSSNPCPQKLTATNLCPEALPNNTPETAPLIDGPKDHRESASNQTNSVRPVASTISAVSEIMVTDSEPSVNKQQNNFLVETIGSSSRLSPAKGTVLLTPSPHRGLSAIKKVVDSPNQSSPMQSLLMYTTPSKQRIVTRHCCVGSRSSKKHSITPLSDSVKPLKKIFRNTSGTSSAKPELQNTPRLVSKNSAHVSRAIELADVNSSLQLLENENFSLVDQFSLVSQNVSNACCPHSSTHETRVTCGTVSQLETEPKVLADASKVPTTADECFLNPKVLQEEDQVDSLACPSKVLSISSVMLQECENEKEKTQDGDVYCEGVSPMVVTVTSSNKGRSREINLCGEPMDTMCYVPGDCSPVLSNRKNNMLFVDMECCLEESPTPPSEPRKSLREDFEIENFSRLFHNENADYSFHPQKSLEDELIYRMKSDLVLSDWQYCIVRRSQGLVRFTLGSRYFYLSVNFGDPVVPKDGIHPGLKMYNIAIHTNYSDDLHPENPVLLKMINKNFKINLNDFTCSSELPKTNMEKSNMAPVYKQFHKTLLECLTDAFFRGRALVTDMSCLKANMKTPLVVSEDGIDFKTIIVSTHLLLIVRINFSIKFDTYPFGVIRPTLEFPTPQSTNEFRSLLLETTMAEKSGETYLWRMFKAARERIRAKEKSVPPIELEPPHIFFK